MQRLKWLKRKKTAREIPYEPPIRLGNMSNGEFFHESTPMEQKIRREILRQGAEKARKLGMDRREFMASAMGMCTSLSVLNMATACSDSGKKGAFIDMGGMSGSLPTAGTPGAAGSGMIVGAAGSGTAGAGVSGGAGSGAAGMNGSAAGAAGRPSTPTAGMSSGSSGMGGTPGSGGTGGYNVPPEATMNCEMAEDILNGKHEFIFDIQTHHIEEEGMWRTTNPYQGDILASFFQQYNGCMDSDLKHCIDAQAYLEHIFLNSDTTMCVLSGFPSALCTDTVTTNCGNPLDNDAMWMSRDRFNALAKSQRVIQHCQVNPNDNLDLQLAIMAKIKSEHNCWGFKCYPEWGPTGKGYQLDSEDIGIPFIEQARKVGSKIICTHKGIVFPGWDASCSHPRDAGVVAVRYPDTNFVVYHSAIELNSTGEGPYNPNNTMGVDRLCRTFEMNDLKGKNLYAELGSCWAQVMNDPTAAQHVIGKLLKYASEDNIVWGSECVWLGSPQPQIEAFRMFQISKEFQDMYGYPELTQQAKAKIFGLNAAKVYGINPDEQRCRIKATSLSALKETLDGELGPRRWAFDEPRGPRTWKEFWALAKWTGGRPG